jgi:hypothetical protein
MTRATKAKPSKTAYQLVDGKAVWQLHATHGFPLEMSIPMLADRHHIPTWEALFLAAYHDGVRPAAMVNRLREILSDAYPKRMAARMQESLQQMPEYLWRKHGI